MKRYLRNAMLFTMLVLISLAGLAMISEEAPQTPAAVMQPDSPQYPTRYQTVEVDGREIFYREAGPKDAPTLLLLHGFPTSSHMFRNLISALSDQFHLVAPDYPGFGNSAMPTVDEFDYTFDNLAEVMEGFIDKLGLEQYSLYLMDYGAPVGYRLAVKHPERVQALITSRAHTST